MVLCTIRYIYAVRTSLDMQIKQSKRVRSAPSQAVLLPRLYGHRMLSFVLVLSYVP